jgi:predicted  nucleic acid-binding Zn-ribbon protein
VEIPIRNLGEKMRQIIADRERSYRGKFSSKLKQVFRQVGSVEKAASNLREAVGRAWGTLSKPAEQHGARLSEQVLEACRSLAARRPEPSYDELRKFQEESIQTIRAIVKVHDKYIPSIIRTVKSESSTLENSIATLSQNITELGQALDSSKLKELQLIAEDTDQLIGTAQELSLKTDEIEQTKEAIKRLQDRGSALQEDLSTLGRDRALKELDQINQQAQQKEAEILALLEPLLKPLRKIDRSDNKALEGSSKAIVTKVVENPLASVVEIPASEMHQLLISVHELLASDELLLDQRRKRRASESIQVLQAGALDRFREDHGILEANRREVLRQLKGSGLYDKWLSVRTQLDDLNMEIKERRGRITELESQVARLRTSVLAGKERIESALKKVLDEQVSILL